MSDKVYVLQGVRHYNTIGFADSWEAYDALSAEDGWVETSHEDSDETTCWKRGTVNGRRFTVHAPHKARDER